MRIHVFQHVSFEDEAAIGDWGRGKNFSITRTRFHEGESPPDPDSYDWLVVMGGPMGIYDEAEYSWLTREKRAIKEGLETDKRILGICLGAQLLAGVSGGQVSPNPEREIGWFPVQRIGGESWLLKGVPETFDAFHWHGDRFFAPDNGRLLGMSDGCPAQIIQIGERALGFQFHLESTPERIQALMDNCPEDMAPGAFVKTKEEIDNTMDRCTEANRIMEAVLENMLQG